MASTGPASWPLTLAAFDIGSNSIRLLMARIDAAGQAHVLGEERRLTRLGAGLVRTGRLGKPTWSAAWLR
jgi:exopolyphosphatase/pppGpp-phosphohydrolase